MNETEIILTAINLKLDLVNLPSPNSPNRTHYASAIPRFFVQVANSGELAKLLSNIGLKKTYIAGTSDGQFVVETNIKPKLTKLKNGDSDWELIHRRSGGSALLQKDTPYGKQYVVAYAFRRSGNTCSWGQGHYFDKYSDSVVIYTTNYLS